MTKPKKTAMAEDVVTRLQGVLRGKGYFTDLGRKAGQFVSRRVRVLSQMQDGEFPAASVLMGPARPSGVMQTGSSREDAQLAILFYGKAEDVTAELERLEADGKRAVLTLPALTGAHGRASHVETVPFYNELEMTDRGVVMVTFTAPFDWTADAP